MIDVTVIGCGFMGVNHAQAVADHPLLRLSSVVDIDKERAQEVATNHGANAAMTDHASALADADAAVIATPERFHAEQTEDALDHNVHVLVEKPITEETANAEALAARTSESDLVTGVSFILRYDPAYAKAQTAARDGELGNLVSARVKRGIPMQESRRIGERGHPLFYMNIHDIDAILATTEQSVVEVVAFERRGTLEDIDVPDATQALLRFEDGLTSVVEGYGILPNDTPGMIDAVFELYGTEGTANVETPGNTVTVHTNQYDRPDTRHWPVVNDRMDGAVARQIDQFSKAIDGDESMLASVYDGYRTQVIAESVLTSLTEGESVTPEDPGPR
jgi:UDP-N-acetylglucosamine 3-dehydrogenase